MFLHKIHYQIIYIVHLNEYCTRKNPSPQEGFEPMTFMKFSKHALPSQVLHVFDLPFSPCGYQVVWEIFRGH